MLPNSFDVLLPDWTTTFIAAAPQRFLTVEERMAFVLELGRLNVKHRTGGPFGAAVFETISGKLIAIGVNCVMRSGISSAHAEVTALSLAQKAIGQWDLASAPAKHYQLVVNAVPCAMCYGAMLWSGITSLVTGASREQVIAITAFDEGPIHPDWVGEANQRGVEVIQGILAEEACSVLRDYKKSGQPIYNSCRDVSS